MDVKNIIQFPLHKVKGGNKMGKLLGRTKSNYTDNLLPPYWLL